MSIEHHVCTIFTKWEQVDCIPWFFEWRSLWHGRSEVFFCWLYSSCNCSSIFFWSLWLWCADIKLYMKHLAAFNQNSLCSYKIFIHDQYFQFMLLKVTIRDYVPENTSEVLEKQPSFPCKLDNTSTWLSKNGTSCICYLCDESIAEDNFFQSLHKDLCEKIVHWIPIHCRDKTQP